MKIIIVGGVAGGASAAARLRRLDEHAEILLFERGPYISFANCGLPYYISGVIEDRDELLLQTPEDFNRRFRVDVRVDTEVTAIDLAAKTVTAVSADGETTESFDKLILSPGAAPIHPPALGRGLPGVFTLRTVPDADCIRAFAQQKPARNALVVGGGPIGLEMAENLRQMGLAVTVAELAPQLFAPLDADMAKLVEQHLRGQGIRLLLSSGIESVEATEAGLRAVVGGEAIETDLVLLALGVRPESGLAKDAGIATDERGYILIDERMTTSHPDVLAVGDAIAVRRLIADKQAALPLAGPANKQGRIAADVLCGIDSRYAGTLGSAIVQVFGKTVAVTGLNERDARAAGFDVEKNFTFSNSHAGYYPNAQELCVKTVFDRRTGRVLGAQFFGAEGADKRCDVVATALRFGATVFDLAALELCYAPPYSSAKDPVNMAGFAAENIVTGKVGVFHWHDVAALTRDGSVQLLDVRTPAEYARGSIAGFVNIPVDDLRGRIGELNPAKPVYVHCHSGVRSYIACRILATHGFRCSNLSGGWRLYSAVTSAE